MAPIGRRRLLGLAATAALSACGIVRFGERGDRVRLAISPGNQTLWRFLEARREDLLRPRGHVVDFVNVGSEDELRDGFVGGKYDVIATLVPALAQLAEAGTPARFFLPIAWLREGYPLVVKDDSPIKSIGDLPGKRLATFPLNHPGFAYWRAFLLKHYGLRGEMVSTLQTLDPQEALTGGQVDAAFVSGNGWALLQQKGGFRKVADLQGEFKWLTGGDRLAVFAGFMAKPAWIDGHKTFVADLTDAARQGLDLYKRDRNAFLDVVTGDATTSGLTRADNQAIATYLGYDAVTPDRVELSKDDIDDFRKFFPLMADAGIIKAPPQDAASLFLLPNG